MHELIKSHFALNIYGNFQQGNFLIFFHVVK
jgi:hypothetical protein